MVAAAQVRVEERLSRLLDHLGVPRAHFAGSTQPLARLVAARPEAVASSFLICQGAFDALPWRNQVEALMVVCGDGSPGPSAVARSLSEVPGASMTVLSGHPNYFWSDVVRDRADEIGAALTAFLERNSARGRLEAALLPEGEGEVAGLRYRVRGSGPPLVLFPIGLAPTQWDALIPKLTTSYCTISVGGRYVGVLSQLEERGSTWGYRKLLSSLVDEMGLSPGDAVLEVGSGSGVVCRWLAIRTAGQSRITGVDVSPYLIREARALAATEELRDRVDFREADALVLPFADASFDATLSVTVMEEVDADRMLDELVRVTRPGGRVGVVVRAIDLPHWFNVSLPPELKAKIESRPSSSKAELGCADASLYRRFLRTGLTDLRMWPQTVTFYPGHDIDIHWTLNQNAILGALSPEEATQWREAVADVETNGGLMWTAPFHCAVGMRP